MSEEEENYCYVCGRITMGFVLNGHWTCNEHEEEDFNEWEAPY